MDVVFGTRTGASVARCPITSNQHGVFGVPLAYAEANISSYQCHIIMDMEEYLMFMYYDV